jgi:hypothetical protein
MVSQLVKMRAIHYLPCAPGKGLGPTSGQTTR